MFDMASEKRGISPLSNHEIKLLKMVGKKITEHAANRGVSIERLAYEAGVSKGYLYDVVKGEGNPSLIILQRVLMGDYLISGIYMDTEKSRRTWKKKIRTRSDRMGKEISNCWRSKNVH